MDKELLSLMTLDCIELKGVIEKLKIMRSRDNELYLEFTESIYFINLIINQYEIKIEGEIKIE